MDSDLVAYFVFVGLLLLFAVCSNMLVIGSVIWVRKLHTVTHVLICNLAVSDLLLGAAYMPPKLHDLTHTENYYEGQSQCRFIHAFPIFVITSACYTLVLISFERRRAIMEISKPQMALKTVFKILPVIWISSLLISLPSALEYSVDTISRGNVSMNTTKRGDCGHFSVAHPLTIADCFFVVIFSFIIPLVLIFRNYINIIVFINNRCKVVGSADTNVVSEVGTSKGRQLSHSMSMSRLDGGHPDTMHCPHFERHVNTHPMSQLSKHRLKIVKMLLLMASAFALCWTPYYGLYVYTKLSGEDASIHGKDGSTLVLNILMSISTAYNVVLYVIFNGAFREAFRECVLCSGK